MMALNAELRTMMALNTELKMFMALNAETENDDGSERQNLEEVVALNVETEKRWWLWTLKLRSDDGS